MYHKISSKKNIFNNIKIGEWKENKAHGKGKFWHVDGDIFEGEW